MDLMILDWIQQNIVCDWLTPVMKCITFFGEYGLGWITIAVALLIPKKTRWIGLSMGIALLAGFLIGECGLKNIIQRLRPFHFREIALMIPAPDSFSCPSGHTTSSFAAATSIFLYKKKWGAAALVLAALIGFSRMYFFVHYPTDILFGIALGVACALAARWLILQLRKKFQKEK